MADIKRDFLYEFNRVLRDVYSTSPSIVSVFESIDNGTLKLSPSSIYDEEFVNEVGKVIFMMKKIAAEPYKSFCGKQDKVPVSQAQSVDKESIKLTLNDPAIWSVVDGKMSPKEAYTLTKEHVYINYENAFISQLITLIIIRLKKIKVRAANEVYDKSSFAYKQFVETVDTYINKLMRLSNERVFADNSSRTVDMSNIFVTDILNSDNRYNCCYKFFREKMRSRKENSSITKDFRVLYHNYALIQILYCLNKRGFKVADSEYYISVSGKMFFDPLSCNGDDKILTVSQTNKGIDISSDCKCASVEFSKSVLNNDNQINSDCKARVYNRTNSSDYVAYLTTSDKLIESALSIGYKDADKTVMELIKAL